VLGEQLLGLLQVSLDRWPGFRGNLKQLTAHPILAAALSRWLQYSPRKTVARAKLSEQT
jgi:hypothetical protein